MSDEEREVREALHAKAGAMQVGRPDESGLLHRLAAARRRRRQVRLAGVAAAVVVALGAASLVTADNPEQDTVIAGPDTSSTTTVVEPSTTEVTIPAETTPTLPPPPPTEVAPGTSAVPAPVTTTIPRTTTTTAPLPPVPDDAIWPAPGSTTTFSTSDRAAADFARKFLGMATPQMGQGRPSAAGNDAIDVRALPTSTLTTTIILRRVEGRGWVVVGCNTPTIVVEQPTAGAKVSSPLTVRGRARAFEGHVNVEVRADGASAPIGKYFGTGASDQLSPFESTVDFSRPSVPRGTVVVSEPRGDDARQGPLAATVLRVTF